MTSLPRRARGFTIVELLIVIVVIGILATIAVVAYSGMQQRTRDVKRVSDLNTLADAMILWSNENRTAPTQTGAGWAGTGRGWVFNSGYPDNIETVLQRANLIGSGVRDPTRPTGTGSYMFYACTNDGSKDIYAFFAQLENPDSQPSNDLDRLTAEGCQNLGIRTQYGMNYAKLFTY